MAVLKLQFSDWKNNPVTQELFAHLLQLSSDQVAKMINRERPDEANDQFIRAFVKVVDEVISWQPDLVSEEAIVEIEDEE
jgi:arsenate reductase-like glutaredoxin family protein